MSKDTNNELSTALLQAAIANCESEIAAAQATVKLYMSAPAGIGDHPDVITEILKAAERGATAQEKLSFLEDVE
jgi:hypothetical protein